MSVVQFTAEGEPMRWTEPQEEERVECTGLAATWCPVHGDCTCEEMENGERSLDDDDCPLHDRKSTHSENAEDAQPSDSVSISRDLAQRILAELERVITSLPSEDFRRGTRTIAAELRARMEPAR